MKKTKILSLALIAVLCTACPGPEPDPVVTKNAITGNNGNAGNGGDDNGGSDSGGNGNSYSPANPKTDKYGIAVSQEVDLGLSVNWASWNVGATKPEEYGGYYAWGETVEKDNYDWSTYKWCRGNCYTMTKYCTNSDYGTVDNRTVLEPGDDVVQKKWGNGWRMPTGEELSELDENCTWEWITYKGVNGYKVTGKRLSNGNRNSIFLPAAGYHHCSAHVSLAGRLGSYWSSTLYSSSLGAYELGFHDHSLGVDGYDRGSGQSVRPVKEK